MSGGRQAVRPVGSRRVRAGLATFAAILTMVLAGAPSAPDATAVHAQSSPTPEEVARRQFASGLEFLKAGRHDEALKDFQTVVESYPATSVADDALLAIARYQLETRRDAASAQATAESILRKFPASDSVAMAYVVAGRALVDQGLTEAHVDAALASFERVPRLFPGSTAVAPAMYAAGETLRRLGRCDEALDRFDRVALQYPRSEWTARGRISTAICLTASGRVTDAMSALYRVTAGFPDTEAARTARTLSTILYRLHVRPPAEPPYAAADRSIGGPAGRLRDVSALAIGDGLLYAAGRSGVQVFDAAGVPQRSSMSGDLRSIALDRQGRPVALQRALLLQGRDTGPPTLVTLTTPRSDGPARILNDLSAVAVLSSSERLVADRGARGVYRFSAEGKFIAPFSTTRAARIAVGPSDRVALLDRDNRTVVLLESRGTPIARLAPRGTGYELSSPEDVAFDALGHLYVLDKTAVVVFAPGSDTPLATFRDSSAAGGGLRNGTALALDEAARLFIYDESAGRVLVYE